MDVVTKNIKIYKVGDTIVMGDVNYGIIINKIYDDNTKCDHTGYITYPRKEELYNQKVKVILGDKSGIYLTRDNKLIIKSDDSFIHKAICLKTKSIINISALDLESYLPTISVRKEIFLVNE
jgi:hypothetical protein